jgi:hypothetical protein
VPVKVRKWIGPALAAPPPEPPKARFADQGDTVLPGSPAEFVKLIAEETEKWAKVVKFSGARADPRDAQQT